jgi:hypothetical protein
MFIGSSSSIKEKWKISFSFRKLKMGKKKKGTALLVMMCVIGDDNNNNNNNNSSSSATAGSCMTTTLDNIMDLSRSAGCPSLSLLQMTEQFSAIIFL